MTTLGSWRMPSLADGSGWVNTEPLGPADLRGHVVLVNFWTLTCINWLRQEPYVRAWARAYRDDGLIVVGVHTPEFSFEHDAGLVRHATAERGIDYPVVADNDYGIWRSFGNHFWPALYFADRDGVVRDSHFGEGRYVESERTIQRLLGIEREPLTVEGSGVEAAADWEHLRTPETYLGYHRGEPPLDATFDKSHTHRPPAWLPFNRWALAGDWTVGPESVSLDRAGGSVAIHFKARDAHLVLSAATPEPIPFRVFLDGQAPGPAHGTAVDEAGNGVLDRGRLYQLVRQRDAIRERTLEIAFLEAGARAYAFTFG